MDTTYIEYNVSSYSKMRQIKAWKPGKFHPFFKHFSNVNSIDGMLHFNVINVQMILKFC